MDTEESSYLYGLICNSNFNNTVLVKMNMPGYAATCDGKMAFNTRQAAERVARAMNSTKRSHNRKSTGHAPARVYKCPFCHEYHITGRKSVKIEIKEG